MKKELEGSEDIGLKEIWNIMTLTSDPSQYDRPMQPCASECPVKHSLVRTKTQWKICYHFNWKCKWILFSSEFSISYFLKIIHTYFGCLSRNYLYLIWYLAPVRLSIWMFVDLKKSLFCLRQGLCRYAQKRPN